MVAEYHAILIESWKSILKHIIGRGIVELRDCRVDPSLRRILSKHSRAEEVILPAKPSSWSSWSWTWTLLSWAWGRRRRCWPWRCTRGCPWRGLGPKHCLQPGHFRRWQHLRRLLRPSVRVSFTYGNLHAWYHQANPPLQPWQMTVGILALLASVHLQP